MKLLLGYQTELIFHLFWFLAHYLAYHLVLIISIWLNCDLKLVQNTKLNSNTEFGPRCLAH